MKKITQEDLLNILEYEKVRKERRKEIIALKNRRRIQAGEHVSLMFENRETVINQIQEMMRIERIVDEDAIQEEIDVYNELIPDRDELAATLFIEFDEPDRIKSILDNLFGLDDSRYVYFLIDGELKVPAVFEEGHSNEERISSVHYCRFPFTGQAKERLRSGRVELVIDHPNYKYRREIPEETRAELLKDLEIA